MLHTVLGRKWSAGEAKTCVCRHPADLLRLREIPAIHQRGGSQKKERGCGESQITSTVWDWNILVDFHVIWLRDDVEVE